MTRVLSARKYWCQPGEQILWMRDDTLHNAEYAVDGLERDGHPKRGIGSKTLRAMGRGAMRTVDFIASTDQDTVYDDTGGEAEQENFADLLVVGPDPDCHAVNAILPWRNRKLPGWEPITGSWTLTPQRLAWLVPVAQMRKLDKVEEKGKPGLTSNLVRATATIAADIAVGTVKMIGGIGDYPAGKPIELPELTAAVEVPRDRFRSVGVVSEGDRATGPCFLQVALVDGSGFRFRLGHGSDTALHVRSMIAGG